MKTVFDIAREVSDDLQFEELIRARHNEELVAERTDQRNIDPKQIANGSGTVEMSSFTVPGIVAEALNDIPNPDRNGLVLLWSYNLHKLFNGREAGIMSFIRHIYRLGERSYGATPAKIPGGKKGRKPRDETPEGGEFSIKPIDIGFTPSLPLDMRDVSQTEYEKLLRFVTLCFLPSMEQFLKRWSVGLVYKSINFQSIALNVFKGTREIRYVSASLSSRNS
jgi:hypothetical protein